MDMPGVIKAVEQAFRDLGQGKAHMPMKAYLVVEKGDFRAMPAALSDAAGVKWVNVHPDNPSLGLPTVMAVMIYNDPATGYPLAILDATDVTAYRTGAVGAVASKYLARKNSRTLGIIGAGRQAYTQLLAQVQLFKFEQIRVFDVSKEAVEKLISFYPQYPVRAASLAETAASDILCTVTPVREPIVKKEWIRPGTHINAIGADAEGKEELEPAILKGAIVVVDDLAQASAAGEINVPIRRGLFKTEEIHATLSEIVLGKKPGRKSEQDITIFDATGVAIEDVATAKLIYEKAKAAESYPSIEFVS
jgi:alanine dehydrogenase